jgi:nicotinamide-nucleotide amidase
MTVALLSIGTELLCGEVVDVNGPWLAAELTEMGFTVGALEVVSDEPEAIAGAARRLLELHGIVLCTGGLGPTPEDRTAQALADLAGVALRLDEDALAAIRRRVVDRGKELREGHHKQAMVPEGSDALLNPGGTATGFVIRSGRSTLYALPGVPPETRRMFSEQVAPRIRPSATRDSFQTTLHVLGMGEAEICERLGSLLAEFPGATLGLRAHPPEVDLKIVVRSGNYVEARERAAACATAIRERLSSVVFGEGAETLAFVAARAVRARGWRLACAESGTGGMVASALALQPASEVFAGAAVTDDNVVRKRLLGVSEDTMRGHGAVSAEVAAEMAEGARRAFDCEVAVAVTANAGAPGPASHGSQGLCYWAVSHPGGTIVDHGEIFGSAQQVQAHAASAVLDLLRRTLGS